MSALETLRQEEANALQVVRDLGMALDLTVWQRTAVTAAVDSYARAHARRVVAEKLTALETSKT